MPVVKALSATRVTPLSSRLRTSLNREGVRIASSPMFWFLLDQTPEPYRSWSRSMAEVRNVQSLQVQSKLTRSRLHDWQL